MKRIYHHYLKWEETTSGMWDTAGKEQEQELLEQAVRFTGNAALYGSYMRRIIAEWPISCEQALTNPSMNQLAWVGHAATALAIRCPEYITRRAWGMLTEQQRVDADAQALGAVQAWKRRARFVKEQSGFSFDQENAEMDKSVGAEGL